MFAFVGWISGWIITDYFVGVDKLSEGVDLFELGADFFCCE
jgi:hypothetical protein